MRWLVPGDVVSTWAWLVWVGLILVFVVIEMLSLDFTFLMIAVGSVGGLVSGLLGAPWPLQIVVAGVLSVVLLFVVRPPLYRRLHRGADPAKSNVEALLGLGGTVVSAVDERHGQVKLQNGDTWTARSAEPVFAPGRRVVVTAIEGATAVVEPTVAAPGDPAERTVAP